jgi:hypothetical protein
MGAADAMKELLVGTLSQAPGSAIERWVDETNQRDLPELIRELLDELGALTANRRPKSARATT